MGLSVEAIITFVGVLVGAPCSAVMLWHCIRRRKQDRVSSISQVPYLCCTPLMKLVTAIPDFGLLSTNQDRVGVGFGVRLQTELMLGVEITSLPIPSPAVVRGREERV